MMMLVGGSEQAAAGEEQQQASECRRGNVFSTTHFHSRRNCFVIILSYHRESRSRRAKPVQTRYTLIVLIMFIFLTFNIYSSDTSSSSVYGFIGVLWFLLLFFFQKRLLSTLQHSSRSFILYFPHQILPKLHSYILL